MSQKPAARRLISSRYDLQRATKHARMRSVFGVVWTISVETFSPLQLIGLEDPACSAGCDGNDSTATVVHEESATDHCMVASQQSITTGTRQCLSRTCGNPPYLHSSPHPIAIQRKVLISHLRSQRSAQQPEVQNSIIAPASSSVPSSKGSRWTWRNHRLL